jgi:hypothetical protein
MGYGIYVALSMTLFFSEIQKPKDIWYCVQSLRLTCRDFKNRSIDYEIHHDDLTQNYKDDQGKRKVFRLVAESFLISDYTTAPVWIIHQDTTVILLIIGDYEYQMYLVHDKSWTLYD